MCQPNVSKFQPARAFPLIVAAIALVTAAHAISGQPERGGQSASTPKPSTPPRGGIFVDVETDSTGAVARLIFLNKVPPEIQEWIRKKTLGRHFGVPNHSYRRHVQYELIDPPKRAK
jgi:hypothetical protein